MIEFELSKDHVGQFPIIDKNIDEVTKDYLMTEIAKNAGFKTVKSMIKYLDKNYDISTPKKFRLEYGRIWRTYMNSQAHFRENLYDKIIHILSLPLIVLVSIWERTYGKRR